MTSIGIVGTGISGLQLALTLQQAGIDTTVYAEHSPDDMRRTRLPNMVMRFSRTVARERELGVEHWAQSGSRIEAVSPSILGTPIAFTGRLAQDGSAVDFRVYLSRLLEDYADRGGHVVIGRRSPDDIVAGIGDHDLTVVASGRESINAFFPRVAERSPHSAPQRLLCAALCHGITPRASTVMMWNAPGVGEGFLYPFFSTQGLVSVIGFEAIPGGPLEPINRVRYDDDPAAFERLALDLLAQYAPPVYECIDPSEFAITGPLDMMQGSVTPTVRRPYCEVEPGRFVVAVGDAYVANDPICGQGANLASTTAAVLAQAICQDVAYDEWFCHGLDRKLWAVAEPVNNFNNSFLLPPKPHVEMILGAATQHQSVADAFCNNFSHPAAMWQAMATPERAATFLASVAAAPAMAA